MDIQASIYPGSINIYRYISQTTHPPALNLRRSAAHSSSWGCPIQQAGVTLTTIASRIFKFLRTTGDLYRYSDAGQVPLHVLAKAQLLQVHLDNFYKDFLTPPADCKDPKRLAVAKMPVLRLNYLTTVIALSTGLHMEESIYDRYIADFQMIVDLAADVLAVRRDKPPNLSNLASFSIDMRILYPLYMVAQKCRISNIRWRAINLLKTCPASEGTWDGPLHALLAEPTIRLEEDGLDLAPSDDSSIESARLIPEFRRVHSTDVHIDSAGQKAILTFKRLLNGVDGGWTAVTKVVTWSPTHESAPQGTQQKSGHRGLAHEAAESSIISS